MNPTKSKAFFAGRKYEGAELTMAGKSGRDTGSMPAIGMQGSGCADAGLCVLKIGMRRENPVQIILDRFTKLF